MTAHHNGHHPHHRADAPTVSHHQHDPHTGHDKHAGHSVEMFRQKFWGTLLLSVPTIVWAPMIQEWFGYEAPGGSSASRWISALFGSLVFGYGGWVFIQGAKGKIADRRPGMMTLIALAITVAFAFSLAVTLGFPGMDLWWELATLVTIMVLGHWVEMRSISQAQGALNELAKLLPDTATRLVGDRTEEVPASDLKVGDLILLRPGASVPADGTVRDGTSDVNESMITGESRPVAKSLDAHVIAGTVNGGDRRRSDLAGPGNDHVPRHFERRERSVPMMAGVSGMPPGYAVLTISPPNQTRITALRDPHDYSKPPTACTIDGRDAVPCAVAQPGAAKALAD